MDLNELSKGKALFRSCKSTLILSESDFLLNFNYSFVLSVSFLSLFEYTKCKNKCCKTYILHSEKLYTFQNANTTLNN